MSKTNIPKTPVQVRAEMLAAGVTISGWARANGFDRTTVVELLHGRNKGKWGESHRCAIALGLKVGTVVHVTDFKPAPKRPQARTQGRAAA